MEWFPDKKGVASGIMICGFGSGALVFTPMVQELCKFFSKMPTYLGPEGSLKVYTEGGKRFAQIENTVQEVVIAQASDLKILPYSGMHEGIYLAYSGSTGAA